MEKKNSIFKIELLVLKTLNEKDCYGYEICTLIKQETKGLFDIKLGVLYPILYKLENEHLISSFEKTFNNRVRIYYHIEKSGVLYYISLVNDFENNIRVINEFLRRKLNE